VNDAPNEDVRVLIVDDQAPFRDAAHAVLGAMTRFTVVGMADTGEAGLALARSMRPDLVLLDVNLPGVSGAEVARLLTGEHPATVVVLVSTYDQSEFGDEVSQCGAAGYLRKSDFGADRLLDLLDGRGCGEG
jgi:DNA-binding NarL/FixJ family response regulator